MATAKRTAPKQTPASFEAALQARIRSLRKLSNFTLAQLAAQSGLTLNAISKFERGERTPNLTSLFKLADALGVSMSELFSETAPPLPAPLRGMVTELNSRSSAVQTAALKIVRAFLAALDSRG